MATATLPSICRPPPLMPMPHHDPPVRHSRRMCTLSPPSTATGGGADDVFVPLLLVPLLAPTGMNAMLLHEGPPAVEGAHCRVINGPSAA